MALTYSISSGITYAETFPDFNALLQSLPDNVQRLISPRDVRDSIFTTWENTVFKVTQAGSSDYIGIGQDLLKSKIYFGKKSLNSAPIMNSDLLSNENIDFYFYNTKADSITNQNTRIAFLAGPELDFINPVGQLGAPQIESAVVETSGGSQYLDFNILNTSNTLDANNKRIGGNINVKSEVGNVSINDFVLPTTVQNTNSDNDGKFLKFVWDASSTRGYGTWAKGGGGDGTTEIVLPDGSKINGIYATQVFYNNPNVSTQEYGSLKKQAFNMVSLHEILTKMLYVIQEPLFSVSFNITIIESGDTVTANTLVLNYSWTRRDLAYTLTGFTLSGLPYTGTLPTPDNVKDRQQSGSTKPQFDVRLPLDTQTNKYLITKSFTMEGILQKNQGGVISDIKDSDNTFTILIPHYYILGPVIDLTNTNTRTDAFNNMLQEADPKKTKIIKRLLPLQNYTATLNSTDMTISGAPGEACLYIAYPDTNKNLTKLIQGSFDYMGSNPSYKSYTVSGITSPNNFWGGPSENREFKIWQLSPGGGAPDTAVFNDSYNFQFA